MDHLEATRVSAVEKYLLNELPPASRDAFEEHYFDCQECTADLKATAAFMDAAREEFKVHPAPALSSPAADAGQPKLSLVPSERKPRRTALAFLQKPAFAAWALAASLLVIGYQNLAVFPHLESQVAELKMPEVLPTLSLAGSNSRGESVPTLALRSGHPFLLAVDIAAEERFNHYTCVLYSPSGEEAWRVQVSPEAAKDLVTIHAPAMRGNSGRYTLATLGNMVGNSNGSSIELAREHFQMDVQQ